MNLLCPYCNEMPLIKITFIKKGSVLVIVRCKCDRKFHDLSTFVDEYITNIKNDQNDLIKENTYSQNKLTYFCETCFLNIYEDDINIIERHKGHKLIKIDKDNNNIITRE